MVHDEDDKCSSSDWREDRDAPQGPACQVERPFRLFYRQLSHGVHMPTVGEDSEFGDREHRRDLGRDVAPVALSRPETSPAAPRGVPRCADAVFECGQVEGTVQVIGDRDVVKGAARVQSRHEPEAFLPKRKGTLVRAARLLLEHLREQPALLVRGKLLRGFRGLTHQLLL